MAVVISNPVFDPMLEANEDFGGSDPEYFSSEGFDVEYISRMLKESEDDPRPGITLEELKKKHREKYGYGL